MRPFDASDPRYDPLIIVEVKSQGHLTGRLLTIEIEVGTRIKNSPVKVELLAPGHGIVEALFRDVKVIRAPSPQIISSYNSVLIRNIKVRASKLDRVRRFFGSTEKPADFPEIESPEEPQ